MNLLEDPLKDNPKRSEIRHDLNIFLKHQFDMFMSETENSKKHEYLTEMRKILTTKYGDTSLSFEFRKLTSFPTINPLDIDKLEHLILTAINEP